MLDSSVDSRMKQSFNGVSDTSFMAILNQAGVGTRMTLNTNTASTAHLNDIVTNFVSKNVRKICGRLASEMENLHSSDSNDKSKDDDDDKDTFEEHVNDILKPSATDTFAAVIMVDVSGYSKLTAILAERGPAGAELLSKTMKGYMDQIIEVIISYGGDIVKFAGDAVVVYWSSATAINMTNSKEDIERGELVYKAAHCCLTLLTKLGTYDINIPDCATKVLRIHLGIGAGLVTDVVVGGFPGRWEHFIAGEAVNQLSQVLDLARAGELALSHQALKWLVWVVDIRTLSLGEYDKRCIILQGLAKAERRVPAPKKVEENVPIASKKQREDSIMLYRQFMDRTALFKLQSDINQSNLFQLKSNLAYLLDLSELRQITTIFIKIESLKVIQRDELLGQCQSAISVVQQAMSRCGGSLRQFQVDDKGAAILCFFGLPPLAHENNAKLAISAAIEVREKFLDMFEDFSMGIATGVVSFGGVGSVGRAEYAVMGDSINMAARLMCNGEATHAILCDQKTYNLCDSEFEFENLGETKVKGKTDPIAIFRPLFAIPDSQKAIKAESDINGAAVVGRKKEKMAIKEILNQLKSSISVDVLLFSGDGGLGLSTIMTMAKAEALAQGCSICVGKGIQNEQKNFFVFRSIVLDLIELLLHGSRNVKNQFLIPGNAGTVGVSEENVILPLNTFPIKPGTKPKRKDPKGLNGSSDQKPANNGTQGSAYSLQVSASDYLLNFQLDPSMSQVKSDSLEAKIHEALQKLDMGKNEAALLLMVCGDNEEAQESDQAHLRLHAKDFSNILIKIINLITMHNQIVIQVTESHWVDSLSWELLLELTNFCPRVSIMSFSRPEQLFDHKETRRVYKLIEQNRRTQTFVLEGLSIKECHQMIMTIWNSHAITTVDPKICDIILKRTSGNPFFIRSLAMALKESGLWKVSSSGVLTTPGSNFDIDKLVLGYDNQSMVLAQFDRLERHFQLLLKVASVLGQKFALDDVLYFLTGMQNASEQVDKKHYAEIVQCLHSTDKYGYLTPDTSFGEGVSFQFKSALVRKCIYDMMVANQRQQIHFLIAQYLESRTTDHNRQRYVVQILEHYMASSDQYEAKRLFYTAMAANYYYEVGAASDSIKYSLLLLELYAAASKTTDSYKSDIANCQRELGYMLLKDEQVLRAETHLKIALALMNFTFPPAGYKARWALKTEQNKRKRLEKIFFKERPVPHEEDYTQSYVVRKGASGYSLTNLSNRGTSNKVNQVRDITSMLHTHLSPAQQTIRDTRLSVLRGTQHALSTLAEVYLRKGDLNMFQYVVLVGLNITTDESLECHLSTLYSLGAFCIRFFPPARDSPLAAQYMAAGSSYDFRTDIYISLSQVKHNALLLFYCGQLEASSNKIEVVSYLSTIARDIYSRICGLQLKCFIQTLSVSREAALSTAKTLLEISDQREIWSGKFWANYHIIHNLLGDSTAVQEIDTRLKEMNGLILDAPKDTISTEIASMELGFKVLKALASYFMKRNSSADLTTALESLSNTISILTMENWRSFSTLPLLSMALMAEIRDDESTVQKTLVVSTLRAVIKALKPMNRVLSISVPARYVLKGMIELYNGNKRGAVSTWRKGVDDESEDSYTQAILNSFISEVEPGTEESEKAEDLIRDLKAAAKFATVCGV